MFDFTNWRMPGWTIDGSFLHWPTRSRRLNFNAGGKPFVGTCEDGRGDFDDSYTGVMTSAPFMTAKSKLRLLVGGGSGPGVYVELIDASGRQIAVARGKNDERMEEVVWTLPLDGLGNYRVRIVDNEKGGWGHINVGNIRLADQ
jgi:hypothetical protein